MQWTRQTALISGASRGLGLALAREIAARGGRVVLVARHPDFLDRAVAGIRTQGGEAYGITADISDIHAIYPIVACAAELAGPITLLVNNASSLGPVPLRAWLDTECEDLARVLETNLVGPFRLTKALLGSMLLRGEGTVVNISSDAAVNAYPGWGAYSVSKAALAHLTRTWSEELRESPVRFLNFDPGEMNTVMHADALPGADPSSLQDPADVALRLLSRIEELA